LQVPRSARPRREGKPVHRGTLPADHLIAARLIAISVMPAQIKNNS